jgi:hypothetical protein
MGERGSWMTTMIECTEGHYEVQETSYGKTYVWCHEHVVVKCDCGERPLLSASQTLCRCGARPCGAGPEGAGFPGGTAPLGHRV